MLNRYFIALTAVILFCGFSMAEDKTLLNMNSNGKDIVVSVDGDKITMSVKCPGAAVDDGKSTANTVKVDGGEKEMEAAVPVADAAVMTEKDSSSGSGVNMGMLFFVFILAIFLGVELISKVPSQLHTPLMSGSNAISGITVVGALLAVRSNIANGNERMAVILGVLAVALAMINVVGGYLVTDRMLGMFKHKD